LSNTATFLSAPRQTHHVRGRPLVPSSCPSHPQTINPHSRHGFQLSRAPGDRCPTLQPARRSSRRSDLL